MSSKETIGTPETPPPVPDRGQSHEPDKIGDVKKVRPGRELADNSISVNSRGSGCEKHGGRLWMSRGEQVGVSGKSNVVSRVIGLAFKGFIDIMRALSDM
jgi:hypothetical protein